MNPEVFAAAAGVSRELALKWADPVAEALNLGKCRTPAQVAVFIASCGHESMGYRKTSENLNYTPKALLSTSPFNSRMTPGQAKRLGRTAEHPADQKAIAEIGYGGRGGNIYPGDGWLFRGSGLAHLTFRNNFRRMGKLLGEPYEDNPDMVREIPRHAALTAGQFWADNDIAALGGDILAASRALNLGNPRSSRMPNGWIDRQTRFNRALPIILGATPKGPAFEIDHGR